VLKKVIKNIALSLAFLPSVAIAQELNCTVQVVSPQVQDASAQLVFKNMQDAIYQFMNSTKWTNDNFDLKEKIECTIFINITGENSASDFNATMQVQSRRPVYKSSYNSTMMNYQDNNVHIVYQLNQPMLFNLNTYSDNITSMLAFYAYMILGYDYDSFSLNGGSPYFLKAQNIVNNAQNSGEKGWNPQDGEQTRYWMVSNALDETFFGPLRKAMYDYHRLGLDVMYNDVEKGRQQIISSLQLVEQVFNARPSNFNVLLFFNAKATEIANIFSEAPDAEKSTVLTILNAIDATDADKFTKLHTE
jgi:hypothetical protein